MATPSSPVNRINNLCNINKMQPFYDNSSTNLTITGTLVSNKTVVRSLNNNGDIGTVLTSNGLTTPPSFQSIPIIPNPIIMLPFTIATITGTDFSKIDRTPVSETFNMDEDYGTITWNVQILDSAPRVLVFTAGIDTIQDPPGATVTVTIDGVAQPPLTVPQKGGSSFYQLLTSETFIPSPTGITQIEFSYTATTGGQLTTGIPTIILAS